MGSMADDDQDRTREEEAEREAEIESELERVDEDPDQVDEGSENLGGQSSDSGTPRGGDDDGSVPDGVEGEADDDDEDDSG